MAFRSSATTITETTWHPNRSSSSRAAGPDKSVRSPREAESLTVRTTVWGLRITTRASKLFQISQRSQTMLLEIRNNPAFLVKPQHHAGNLNLDFLTLGLVPEGLRRNVQFQMVRLTNAVRVR